MRKPALLVGLLGLSATPLFAASHLWVIQEVFSNADGSIQFVEMYNCCAANETGLANKYVSSDVTGIVHTFTQNLPPDSTTDKHLLLATQAFADLPGAPAPDAIIAPNSIAIDADSIQWWFYSGSVLSYGAGQLPTDGLRSFNRVGGSAVNSPTNFDGDTGSIDASGGAGPPAVPDGTAGTTPMTVAKLDPAGSNLSVAWDTSSCTGEQSIQLVYGDGSGLASLALLDGVCDIEESSPFSWSAPPTPDVDRGMIWWLMLATDGSGVEGSWGVDSLGVERNGPLASGLCSVTTKDASNACGVRP